MIRQLIPGAVALAVVAALVLLLSPATFGWPL